MNPIFFTEHGAVLYDQHHLAIAAKFPGTITYPLRDMPNAGRAITSLSGAYPGVYSATGVTLQSAGPPLAGELVKAAALTTGAIEAAYYPATAFTVSMWIKTTTTTLCGVVVFSAGTNRAPGLVYNVDGLQHMRLWLGAANYADFTGVLNDGIWHHFAVTLPGANQADISSCAAYLDGAPMAKSVVATGAQLGRSNLRLGLPSWPFSGTLAYACISPGPWSAADVRLTYEKGVAR